MPVFSDTFDSTNQSSKAPQERSACSSVLIHIHGAEDLPNDHHQAHKTRHGNTHDLCRSLIKFVVSREMFDSTGRCGRYQGIKGTGVVREGRGGFLRHGEARQCKDVERSEGKGWCV